MTTRREERIQKLKAGKVENYRTEDGRPARLFYGPFSETVNGRAVGMTGYAVDTEGSIQFGPARRWYVLLEDADRYLFAIRAKNEIDIAREALRLPIVNDDGT